MNFFHCDHCGALVFFENVSCLQCGHALGFLPDIMDLAALEPEKDQQWRSLSTADPGRLAELYPFILSRPVVEKLRFVHDTIRWREPVNESAPEAEPALELV